MQLKNSSLLKRGEYRIEKVLGQGGFGITYLAEQTSLQRKVAIKEFFMKEHCNRDTETSRVSVPSVGSRELVERFRQKFIKEARTIASFSNAHIISIHDVFEENGTAYYVMEYLEGNSLVSMVKEQGVMSETLAVKYISQVAEALAEVHANKLLHLDVKPANIMLNKKGEAVLIDFGISKHYDESGVQTSSASVGVSEGYAPLEQYEAGALDSFTPATDIYALGATLFFLLTGKRPPKASEVMNYGLPEFPSNVSPSVRNVIAAAMHPVVRMRPQSIAEFLNKVKGENGKVKTETEDAATVVNLPRPSDNPGGKVKCESFDNEETRIDSSSTPGGEVSQSDGGESELETESRNVKTGSSDNEETQISGFPTFGCENGQKGKSEAAVRVESDATRLRGDKPKSGIALWIALLSVLVIGACAWFFLGGAEEYDDIPMACTINGHEYVDLGLPSGLKWATCNVGASSPSDNGYYYAWGETEPQYNYIHANSKTIGKQMGSIAGNPAYDVASKEWGDSWRLPTKAEFQELIDYCTWIWTFQEGKAGYEVTSRNNGNCLFLPTAGWYNGTSLEHLGTTGFFWCATPFDDNTGGSYGLYFDKDRRYMAWGTRYLGHSVRPVSE